MAKSTTPHRELRTLDAVASMFGQIKHCRALDIAIVSVERGSALLRLPYSDRIVGDPEEGVVHGGVVTTLMDSAGGCAALSLTPEGHTIATLDLRIDYLRPATSGQDLRGFAECYKHTRNLAFLRGLAYNKDRSDPVANFTACFMSRAGNLMPGMDWNG